MSNVLGRLHGSAIADKSGVEKRKAAQKAEADFFALLREKAEIGEHSTWKEVKRGLDKDPRYDAVGSSSLREELFNTYRKSLARGDSSATARVPASDSEMGASAAPTRDGSDLKRLDREKKARAVREREDKVRRERERLDVENARSRDELSREEDELQFLCAIISVPLDLVPLAMALISNRNSI